MDIRLLGRDYQVNCPPDEEAALGEAVQLLDQRLGDLGVRTQSSGERLAVMTALNIMHEFLQFRRAGGFDVEAGKRRIDAINAQLDAALGVTQAG